MAKATPLVIDDPVMEAATHARAMAPRCCRLDPVTGETCAWYHSAWPSLRLLGIVTEPSHHVGYFVEHLAPAADARVLVCGAADHALPALVFAVWRAAGVTPDVTVLDRCATPLRLCEWYADRVGQHIATVHSDILDYGAEGRFDVICTHALLGHFSAQQRRALAAVWYRLLRPGGRVVTVNRIRPGLPDAPIGFTPDEAGRLAARVMAAAQAAPARIGLYSTGWRALVEPFTRHMTIRPVPSVADAVAPLEEAGFAVETQDLGPAETGMAAQPSGPTAFGAAQYVGITAIRR